MARHVTLVVGPPCAGKSTWVAQRRQPGDLVIDADDIARRLGSPRRWLHQDPWRTLAQRAWADQARRVAAAESGTAWIIRSVPEARDRAALAQALRADRVVVLLPPAGVLIGRAQQRPDPYRTAGVIRRWLARYSPSPTDETVT